MVKKLRLWGCQAGEVPAQGLLLSFYWMLVVTVDLQFLLSQLCQS